MALLCCNVSAKPRNAVVYIVGSYSHSLEELDLILSSLFPSALSLVDAGSVMVPVPSKVSLRDGVSVTIIEGKASAMVQTH